MYNANPLNFSINSRTFCLYENIEIIKKNGLAKGGSLDNAIVVKNESILNKENYYDDLFSANESLNVISKTLKVRERTLIRKGNWKQKDGND